MEIPQRAFTADLTDYQFRLLALMCHISGSKGSFKTSVAELGRRTNKSSDKTVRSALQALEQHGFISRSKTRRANGKRGVDNYTMTVENYRLSEEPAVTIYRTSLDNSTSDNIVDKPLVPNLHTSNKYFETKGFEKKEKASMRKYEDDDDNLSGFGLLEPKDAPQQNIRKSDPRTRGKRPQHEWTPMDVAAEFSFLVGRKYPLLPGTVSVKQLSGALAKFRKQYGTTALIELELLKMFMEDERNFRSIGDEAPHLYKLYLASFRTNMNKARENLGLGRVAPLKEPVVKIGTLVASDGRVFQNSLSGRAQLDRHEKRLKEKSNG